VVKLEIVVIIEIYSFMVGIIGSNSGSSFSCISSCNSKLIKLLFEAGKTAGKLRIDSHFLKVLFSLSLGFQDSALALLFNQRFSAFITCFKSNF
jgi:hypothetical protein